MAKTRVLLHEGEMVKGTVLCVKVAQLWFQLLKTLEILTYGTYGIRREVLRERPCSERFSSTQGSYIRQGETFDRHLRAANYRRIF